jgi:hypothetical protein
VKLDASGLMLVRWVGTSLVFMVLCRELFTTRSSHTAKISRCTQGGHAATLAITVLRGLLVLLGAYWVQMIKREINRLNQEIGRAEEVVLTHVRHYQQDIFTIQVWYSAISFGRSLWCWTVIDFPAWSTLVSSGHEDCTVLMKNRRKTLKYYSRSGAKSFR